MSGHTPGPWEVEPIETESGSGSYDAFSVVDAEGRVLFDTLNSDHRIVTLEREYDEEYVRDHDEQGRMNLTLAAAAPELLEALIEANEGTKLYADNPGQWAALIAKATGETK